MKEFIRPKIKKGQVNQKVVDRFIDDFNEAIEKGEFALNTGLDNISRLNDEEFRVVKIQALKNGYNLQVFGDNYTTTTYKLEQS